MLYTALRDFGAQGGRVRTAADAETVEAAIRARPGEAAPNGNTVSIEREMLTAAEGRQQHDMALAITKSLGGVIRTSLGRRA